MQLQAGHTRNMRRKQKERQLKGVTPRVNWREGNKTELSMCIGLQ